MTPRNGRRPPERRLAVIDLGSNSFRLVVFTWVEGAWWKRTDEIYESVRIGRGLDAAATETDPRLDKIRQALKVLHDRSGGRAERIQQIFSLDYDAAWERPQPR